MSCRWNSRTRVHSAALCFCVGTLVGVLRVTLQSYKLYQCTSTAQCNLYNLCIYCSVQTLPLRIYCHVQILQTVLIFYRTIVQFINLYKAIICISRKLLVYQLSIIEVFSDIICVFAHSYPETKKNRMFIYRPLNHCF